MHGHGASLGFDASNRIVGDSYAAAGHLLHAADYPSAGACLYGYDGAGRLASVSNCNSASYLYDAAGRRAVRWTPATDVRGYLYGLDGRSLTELAQAAPQGWARDEIYAAGRHLATYRDGNSGTSYLPHADGGGAPCARFTSRPFGGNEAGSGSCTGATPAFFTGQPRDPETGLDDFGFRYNSSSLGRFMTPDWSAEPETIPYARFTDPQSLNLYTYSDNNPVSKTDADGHFPLLGLVGIGVAVGEVATHGAELYYKSQDDAALIRWEQADEKMLNDALYGPNSKIDTENLIKEINMLRAKLGWALLDTGQTLEQVLEPITKVPTSAVTQAGATVEKDIGVIVDTSTKASVTVTQKIGSPKEKGQSQTQQTGQSPQSQPQPKQCDKPDGQDCQ